MRRLPRPHDAHVALVALAAAGLLCACSTSDPVVLSPPDPPALVVRPVDWNPSSANVGKVAALVERSDDLVVLSDVGVTVLASGALISTDRNNRGWKAGALVPAGDGSRTPWLLGVGADGVVRRLLASGGWEPVSDRYGLAADDVRGVLATGAFVVFELERGIAVSDGRAITRYDVGALTGLVGAMGRIAGLTTTGAVRVFDVASARAVDYAISGTGVGLRADGRLVATSMELLYVEDESGLLVPVFESPAAALHGVGVAKERVWFGYGSELGALDSDGVVRLTKAAAVPAAARLVGSSTGDVWLLDDAATARVGPDDIAMAKVRRWEAAVRPIFLAVCAQCHLPGGVARLNLSSYARWIEKRDAIYERVVMKRQMPPAGTVLPEDDRTQLETWLDDPAR